MHRDLLVEDDNSTLSDVFEFIGSLDSDSESSLASVTSPDDEPSSVSSSDHEKVTHEHSISTLSNSTPSSKNSRKKKPRQPGQVPQSTKFQREQRDQVLALRRQVLELTARLGQLQRTRHGPTTTKLVGPPKPKELVSVWEDLAIVQCQERQRSEQTNQELKVVLARQRKLERSICKLLGRKDALEGMELLCRLQPMPESVHFTSAPQLKVDFSDAVLAELEMTVASLYMRTNSLFPTLQGEPMVSFSTKDSYADPLGTYIETKTTTPLSCPLHMAAEILWNGTTKVSQDPEKVPRFMRAKCFNTLARSCKLDLFKTVRIDGINFVRRYIESDRVVLVSAATWFLPAEGIHFQDKLWTIVTRSPVDSQHASVVQSFCQFGAQISGSMTDQEAFASAQEFVKGTIGTKLRHLQEMQQKFLLEHAGSSASVH